jgi:prefoldin subunit 5
MTNVDRLAQLESEVATLQDTVEAMQAVLERLEDRISELEGGNDTIRDAFVEGFEEGR